MKEGKKNSPSHSSCPTRPGEAGKEGRKGGRSERGRKPRTVNRIGSMGRNGKCWKMLIAGSDIDRDTFGFCQLPACLKEVG